VNGELKDVAGNGSGQHEAPNLPGWTEGIYEYQQKNS